MSAQPSPSLQQRLDDLEEQLSRMAREIASQQRLNSTQQEQLSQQQEEIVCLRAALARSTTQAASSHTEPAETTQASPSRGTSRRHVLKLGGTVAAASAAAVAVGLIEKQTAMAADGDSLLLGAANDANNAASTPTTLSVASPATPQNLLIIDDSGETDGIAAVSIASGTTSMGIVGQSIGGYGVVADAGGGIDVWVGGLAGNGRLLTNLQAVAGAPSYSAMAGEQIRDANGDLFLCVASGTPGTWRKVAAGIPGVSGAINFLDNPIRLLDTRNSSAWVAGSTHTLQVTGVNIGGISVPAGAVGVVGNVTVVRASAGGDLRLYPGATAPNTSSINFATGQIIANGVLVGLNSSGQFNIKVDMPTGATINVLFDASGFIL